MWSVIKNNWWVYLKSRIQSFVANYTDQFNIDRLVTQKVFVPKFEIVIEPYMATACNKDR